MTDPLLVTECIGRFSEEARRAVYEAISLRRDVRHFRSDVDIDEAVLERILAAAHLAPSVGFSQPWGFVIIRDRARRARIRESFLGCRQAEAARFPPDRREQYLSYRLEGIVDAPLNLCVAVDLRSRGEAILGTTAQPEAVRASACCAVENLWLAARVEGVGVGWVSIVEAAVLREELALPPGVEPIAYLCVGVPHAFRARPMLEETGWLARRPLGDSIHRETWDERAELPAARRRTGDGGDCGECCSSTRPLPQCEGESAILQADGHPPFDERTAAVARTHQNYLTKPAGSLGRLEDIAVWYAGAIGCFPCAVPERAAVAVFAGDHGVVVEGVSAYGSQMTAAMVCNMMAGGAAINVLARRHRVEVELVDVGVAGDLSGAPVRPEVALRRENVRAGTRNLRLEAAMTRDEAILSMRVGQRTADRCIDEGAGVVGTGEIGIGNTTAAAAMACAMIGAAAKDIVGYGAGIDETTRARKIAVVDEALGRHALKATDPIGVLATVGGLELAAVIGFALRATERRVPVVLDGFLANCCALVARALRPEAVRFFLASHASAERGSGLVLEALGLRPVLAFGMRLGEGTGAVLGIELVRTAVALASQMATFATAGIPQRRP